MDPSTYIRQEKILLRVFTSLSAFKTSSRLNTRHDDTKTLLQAQKHQHQHHHRVALFPRPFSRVCRARERVSILRYLIVVAHNVLVFLTSFFQ